MDWHRHEAVAIPFMELCGQSARFASENEHCVFGRSEGSIPEHTRGFRREKKRRTQRGQMSFELVPTRPHPWMDVLPVVEARAFHFSLVERETERLDEMEVSTRGEAGASGVAGVPVNLGMNENDVDGQERGDR